jgi:CheY-like chemotaxis protein
VLLNLLGNAVKFTSTGHVSVDVSDEATDDGYAALRIAIADTGIGIAPEKLARLFQPFVQGDASMSRRFGGTGLGLVVCRRLVELMNGELGVETIDGKGSTFWFTVRLPLDASAPATAAHRPASLQGARVLLAKPFGPGRDALVAWLVEWGARLDVTDGVESALRRMRLAASSSDPVRVAIFAEGLDGQDALAIAHHVRADRELADVRLLLTGSRLAVHDYAALSAAGADGWISRPWRASVLARVLDGLANEGPRQFVTREQVVLQGANGGRASATGAPDDAKAWTGTRVLLVEDNPTNQKVAARMLERFGCEVVVAASGRAGLEAFAHGRFACVFMDCQMPEMDGYEATREIRRREAGTSRVPIVALTANAMEGDRERCLECGMDDFVSKPIRWEQFRAMLERWCPPSSGERAA